MEIKNIDVEKALTQVMRLPTVKIDRDAFLYKELNKYYAKEVVDRAIQYNPAYAGITKDKIASVAKYSIAYESKRVTAISTALGIPGGGATAITIPSDVSQYFSATLRILQKLAYLYGFEEFDLKENQINDKIMDNVIIFMGVMFGVNGANVALHSMAAVTASHITKTMAHKALTKTAYYPIVKTIAQKLGYQMTKDIFAKSVGKAVPVIGGLTYATFKPCSYRLKNTLATLPLCDPDTYKK